MLDKFYTKPEIAKFCYNELSKILKPNTYTFLEPSAGSGRFLDILRTHKQSFIAYDILPEGDDIQRLDFLNENIDSTPKNLIVLGNPPFGKKSKTAIQFINKAFEYSKIVAFIVPLQFRKYSVQKEIRNDASLILDIELPKNAFTSKDKEYSLRSCFQVWIIDDIYTTINKNLRIIKKPLTKHPDFVMYQYNHTKDTLKYFDYEWDFCVYRQGYVDYTKKFYSKNELDEKQQYIFFKAYSQETLNNLLTLNFKELSEKNTLTPGFGMADVILYYNSFFKERINIEQFM